MKIPLLVALFSAMACIAQPRASMQSTVNADRWPYDNRRGFHPIVEEWLWCTECNVVSPVRLQMLGSQAFANLERTFRSDWANEQTQRCVARETRALQRLESTQPPAASLSPERAARVRMICAAELDHLRIRAIEGFAIIGTPEARRRLERTAAEHLGKGASVIVQQALKRARANW